MACSHFPRLRLSEHNKVSDGLDQLSELPDSLILSILSLLWSTRDVVRTTVLSKRWKDLWTTVPCLNFVDENPEFIYGVVAQWRGAKIQRFYLSLSDEVPLPPTSSDVESWLIFAEEKQVEDLHVDMGSNMPYYSPPQSLYSCSSITKLNLEYNCLLKIDGSVQLNQLVTLLVSCNMDSSSVEAINKILLGAPRLENMSLSALVIDGNFTIQSRSLKTLIIDGAEIKGVLTIRAPNLLALEIHEFFYNSASFLCRVPSLTEACFEEYYGVNDLPLEACYQLLRSIRHVKKVTLSLLHIELLLTMKKKKDMVVRFPNAEVLIHESFHKYVGLLDLLDLLELFPKLKTLSFHPKRLQDFNPIAETSTFPSCSLLHLKRVDITWPAHEPSVIPFIEILLQNSPLLNQLVVRLEKYTDNREVVLMVEEKVRSMPRSSPTAEVIIIDC